MQTISPMLWYDTQAEEAAKFYVSIFPNSKITETTHYSEMGPRPAGLVMTVAFELNGQKFTALNGGPETKFNWAVSFVIPCETQEEVDHYWSKLTSGGGQEVECGWVTDKFGLSWQVTPTILPKLLADPDKEKAKRVFKQMMTMKKLDIQPLLDAAEGR